MKKKPFIISIILFIFSLSVYFFVITPMLDHKDENVTDEENVNKQPLLRDPNEVKEEIEALADKVMLSIEDTIKGAFEYIFAKETQIVAIGDSLTEGVGDGTKGNGYVGILDRTINKEQKIARFYNYGKRGNRTDQMLKRLDHSDIISSIEQANIVLITIGANDIMKVVKENFANLTYEQFANEQIVFEQQLQQIIEKIREYNSYAHIYLIGLYNPFEEYFGDIEELDLIVDEWNGSSEEIMSKFDHTTFIPIKDIFSNHEEDLFAEDHFHPNEFGYYYMAERVLQYVANGERWVP